MSAPHDGWAKALAYEAVTTWRSTDVVFVQRGNGSYDPATGEVTSVEVRYGCGAAIAKVRRIEEGGPAEKLEAEAWFDSTTLPVMPTTADVVEFKGMQWRVIAVDPAYLSDATEYAYKLLLRT